MKKAILILLALAVMMFAEYRYIMTHISPYKGNGDTIYLEIFGQIDEYYAEPISEIVK